MLEFIRRMRGDPLPGTPADLRQLHLDMLVMGAMHWSSGNATAQSLAVLMGYERPPPWLVDTLIHLVVSRRLIRTHTTYDSGDTKLETRYWILEHGQ